MKGKYLVVGHVADAGMRSECLSRTMKKVWAGKEGISRAPCAFGGSLRNLVFLMKVLLLPRQLEGWLTIHAVSMISSAGNWDCCQNSPPPEFHPPFSKLFGFVSELERCIRNPLLVHFWGAFLCKFESALSCPLSIHLYASIERRRRPEADTGCS